MFGLNKISAYLWNCSTFEESNFNKNEGVLVLITEIKMNIS
jgi:hypothetical protein